MTQRLLFACNGCSSIHDVPDGYFNRDPWMRAHAKRCALKPTLRGLMRKKTPAQKSTHTRPSWLKKVLGGK